MARVDAMPRWLAGVTGALFAASVATTIAWARSMAAMDMPMPGGWTMSMTWMRLPDQSWPGAAASFAAMWLVMMVAMMLPVLVPALRRYAAVAGRNGAPVGPLAAAAGAAYFAVWGAAGLVVFPFGAALAAIQMSQPAAARAVPFAVGAVLLAAGAMQFTAAKAQALACCRGAPRRGEPVTPDLPAAWRHGVRLGLHCLRCCSNLMAVLLVLGVMDLGVMAAVTVAITVERVAPAGVLAARIVGAGVVLAALAQLALAAAQA